MRISDWSSDVCSSDLAPTISSTNWRRPRRRAGRAISAASDASARTARSSTAWKSSTKSRREIFARAVDRKSVVEGKSVLVRVDLGGRRIMKKKNYTQKNTRQKYTQ